MLRLPRAARNARLLASLLTLLALPGIATASRITTPEGYTYASPGDGAQRVSPWNNIVLRSDRELDAGSLRASDLVVSGSRSGIHAGRIRLADDGRTAVFTPGEPFALGEEVTVRVPGGLRARAGGNLPAASFRFTIASADPRQAPSRDLANDPCFPWSGNAENLDTPARRQPTRDGAAATQALLPTDYPPVSLLLRDNPDPGAVFVSPFQQGQRGRLMVLDNYGQPLFYRSLPLFTFDFKRQPNGLLTFWGPNNRFYGLDSSYTVVDSFYTGNGYTTDVHECQVLANGHALVMSYDVQPVQMNLVVPGGRADAMVVGLIVQEIDTAKNVVFQWRSWDHFQITDMANSCLEFLEDSLVDYVHGNAIDLDADGNLLISSRTLNEITKINRTTGAVMWRYGLYATQNDFTITNDTRGFRGQHDIRRLPNGNILLFDNGNCNATEYSRAVEYDLDEVGMTATQVWEYRTTPNTFGPFMGSSQRHASGGTTIGWGGTNTADVTEVHANGTKAYELSLGGPFMWSYRAFRFPWTTNLLATSPATVGFGATNLASVKTLSANIHNRSAASIEIDGFTTSDPAFTVTTPAPFTLPPGGTQNFTIRFQPTEARAYDARVYARAVNDTSLVAQSVTVTGTGVAYLPLAFPAVLALIALLLAALAAVALLRIRAREA